MLKNLGYDGAYHDQNISVNVLLENPLDYGLDASTLLFSVTVADKREGAATPTLEEFTFYIMDEANHLCNAQSIRHMAPSAKAIIDDDEPVRSPDGFIFTSFRHEFLFQDMRVAFYYKPCQQINIITLRH